MMFKHTTSLSGLVGALLAASAPMALAQTAPAPAPAPAAAAPASVSLSVPAMSTPLALNPTPYALDVGDLGKWYVSGIASGLAIGQTSTVPGDKDDRFDVSNAQVFIQKIDGEFQFAAELGEYSFPVVGGAYANNSSGKALSNYFGAVPMFYAKVQPTDSFSIQAGKLFTLIGAEGTYTYQNIDISRGLVWNLEPIISRGVQANYSQGAFSGSVQFSDGYYSNRFNWIEGLLSYTINPTNTIAFVGGGNLGSTGPTTAFADAYQANNGAIGNIIYTYNNAPLLVQGYLQYQEVPSSSKLGYSSGKTYSGAVLASYQFDPNFSLGGRFEYLDSTGGINLLGYGNGSKAFTITVTPTYQYNRVFVRADLSYVGVTSATAGDAFGSMGTDKNQFRGILETGVLF